MKDNENLIGNSRHMVDYLGNEYDYVCLGCEIGQKKIIPPGGIIYENDILVLGSEPEIPLAGFLIVTIKKHINSITELSVEEQHKIIDVISKAVSTLKKLNITNEITLIQEERSKHFHVWIFPNQDWMYEKFGKGVSFVRDICDYVLEHATEKDKQEVLKTIYAIKENYN